jgi:hypothetical protein
MRKVLSMVAMIAAFALIVGLGVTAFAQGVGTSPNVPTVTSIDDPSPSSDDPGDDVSGNCDEAEHAGDPECQGVAPGDDDPVDDDNSGPNENSGPGNADDDDSDDDNSGSGSEDDSDDDSDDDDSDDDDSGSDSDDDSDDDDSDDDDSDDDSGSDDD